MKVSKTAAYSLHALMYMVRHITQLPVTSGLDTTKWVSATRKINQLLAETSLVTATWNHPEHRFNTLAKSLEAKKKSKRKVVRRSAKAS